MFGSQSFHLLWRAHFPRGVVGVTHPSQSPVGLFLKPEGAAGIGIFIEGGLQDVARAVVPESLCDEVDGIGGPAGHHHLVVGDAVFLGNHLLQGVGCRLRIRAHHRQSGAQELLQSVGSFCRIGKDVRTEVHPYAVVSVKVVAVSVNHCPVVFGRFSACPHVGAHGRRAGRIAFP